MKGQNARAEALQKILDALQAIPICKQSVPAVAGSCGWSVWHTQRVFSSLTGQSLGAFIRARKLTEAVKLMKNSSLGLLDIALEVGFNSHEAFSRSFQAYFGESPKSYRKRGPAVSPLLKPVLTEAYVEQLSHLSLQPEIRVVPSLNLAGIQGTVPSPFDNSKESTFECVLPLWGQLFNRIGLNPSKSNIELVGLIDSKLGSLEDEYLSYLAAFSYVVNETVDSNLSTIVIPAQTHAVFRNVGGGNSTLHLVNYIYGTWLPQSKFRRTQGCDFETFDMSFKFRDPGSISFYHVPVLSEPGSMPMAPAAPPSGRM